MYKNCLIFSKRFYDKLSLCAHIKYFDFKFDYSLTKTTMRLENFRLLQRYSRGRNTKSNEAN